MEWTIQDLGAIGEFVSAIAVVATLGYLAIQIRQSNSNARAQSRQTLIDTWSSSNWELSKDPEMLRIYANALTSWPDLPDSEKTAFDFGMNRYLANLQNGLLLRQAGMLDQETLDATGDYMLMCVRGEGGARWWEQTVMATPIVREYVESRLADPDSLPAPIDELVPHWTAMSSK